MRVLIGCEYSGVVREAFRALGHDAYSCDILPTEIPGQHIQDDVRNVLDWNWDLAIFHPPCTYLAYSGIAHWNKPGRAIKRRMAADFFMQLYDCDIPHIAVENPVGWMNTIFRKPDQIIHPYYFGDRDMKKTCLWLKNLPLLGFFNYTELPEPLYVHERKPSKHYKGGETKKRYFVDHKGSLDGQERARTFPGIAAAMAAQWSIIDTLPIQHELWGNAS